MTTDVLHYVVNKFRKWKMGVVWLLEVRGVAWLSKGVALLLSSSDENTDWSSSQWCAVKTKNPDPSKILLNNSLIVELLLYWISKVSINDNSHFFQSPNFFAYICSIYYT